MNNERPGPGPLMAAVLWFCRLQSKLTSRGVLPARWRRVFVPTCGPVGRHLPQLLPFAVCTVQPETRQTSRTEPVPTFYEV